MNKSVSLNVLDNTVYNGYDRNVRKRPPQQQPSGDLRTTSPLHPQDPQCHSSGRWKYTAPDIAVPLMTATQR